MSSLLIPSASYLAGTALLGYTLSALLQKTMAVDKKIIPTNLSTTTPFPKDRLLADAAEEFHEILKNPEISTQKKLHLLGDIFWDMGELCRQNSIDWSKINMTQKKKVSNFIELI